MLGNLKRCPPHPAALLSTIAADTPAADFSQRAQQHARCCLLLDGTSGQPAIHEALLLLPIAPHSRCCLLIVCCAHKSPQSSARRWDSIPGFQSGSNNMRRLAPTRFKPQPPACRPQSAECIQELQQPCWTGETRTRLCGGRSVDLPASAAT